MQAPIHSSNLSKSLKQAGCCLVAVVAEAALNEVSGESMNAYASIHVLWICSQVGFSCSNLRMLPETHAHLAC